MSSTYIRLECIWVRTSGGVVVVAVQQYYIPEHGYKVHLWGAHDNCKYALGPLCRVQKLNVLCKHLLQLIDRQVPRTQIRRAFITQRQQNPVNDMHCSIHRTVILRIDPGRLVDQHRDESSEPIKGHSHAKSSALLIICQRRKGITNLAFDFPRDMGRGPSLFRVVLWPDEVAKDGNLRQDVQLEQRKHIGTALFRLGQEVQDVAAKLPKGLVRGQKQGLCLRSRNELFMAELADSL